MKKFPKRKKCSKCNQLKLLIDFPPCKTGKYGVYNYCRNCHRIYTNESKPNRKQIDETKARRIGLRKQGLKTCISCRMVKPLEDFYPDIRRSDKKQSVCKECWIQKNNEKYLMKEYGMTLDDFRILLESQDGVCAICKRPPKKNKFNIDHDHKTHRIRALLCVNCNTNLLPYVERFPEWIKNAFEYLDNPPALQILGERIVPETNQARLKDKIRK